MPLLYPTSHVRGRTVDGRVVLLDLRDGAYVVLDEVATAMWHVLTALAEPERQRAELARRFDAPAERLDTDLAAFATQCRDRGFLGTHPPAAAPAVAPHRAGCGVLELRAWAALLATTRALARRGFADTYRRYACLPRPRPAADPRLAARALRAFSRAENLFVIRGAPRDCLPRSLALYRFLLSAGVPAEHCIGVQRFPFEAHAWVECAGRVVHDTPEFTGCYRELARLGP